MNFYYELNDSVVDQYGGKYFVSHDVEGFRYNRYILRSERVWGEHDDGRVYFVKHRWEDCTRAVVDMKEFFWIKLKSQKA